MRKVYALRIKATDEMYFYSTLPALGEAHGKEEINLTKASLKHIKFDENGKYNNRLIEIRRGYLYSKIEVKNGVHKQIHKEEDTESP